MNQKKRANSKTKLKLINNKKEQISQNQSAKNIHIDNLNSDRQKKPKKKIKMAKSKSKSKINKKNSESISLQNNINNEDENINLNIKPNINYNNIISEKKSKDSIQRLLDSASGLLEQQQNIISECDKLSKSISTNEYEIERFQKRQEVSNFTDFINDYTDNLSNIIEKLKINTKDVEESNKIREENKNLQYKMKMISIDKMDNFRDVEMELSSIKTIYANEINSMINFLTEIGCDNIPINKIAPNNLTSDKITNFFSYIKRVMKNLKNEIYEKDALLTNNDVLKNSNNNQNITSKNINQSINILKQNEFNNNKNDYNKQNYSSNLKNDNIASTNYSNISRLKSIENIGDIGLLQKKYDENNNINNNSINNLVIPNQSHINYSIMDDFKRSKNMRQSGNNNMNMISDDSIGVQLEHNYTDSNFYKSKGDYSSFININKNTLGFNPMANCYNSRPIV